MIPAYGSSGCQCHKDLGQKVTMNLKTVQACCYFIISENNCLRSESFLTYFYFFHPLADKLFTSKIFPMTNFQLLKITAKDRVMRRVCIYSTA